MAQTKTVSSNTSTYVITDAEGSSVTIAATQTFGGGITLIISSSGGLHQDGAQQLTTLMQLLSTGLLP